MRKTWKKLGLLAALCGTAVLFACAKPPAAPENTPHLVQQAQTMQGEETLADMVERLSPAVVGIANVQDGKQGIGSGVFVTTDGYVLTTHHVAAAGNEVVLIFSDGAKQSARTIWSSKALDLAVIKAEGNFACAALGSVESVRAGESVIAIGTPLALQFQHTVTRGIVSAVDRTLQVPSEGSTAFLEQLIQTDAAINPGNSGGPLLNAKGEVIGIITVRVEEAAGIGFAIPIDIAKPILQHFIAEGSFTAPKLGAYLFDSEIARFYDENSTMTAGLYVIGVEPNSPAERAGLREGDILLSADGRTCRTLLDLRYQIFAHRVGEKMALRVLRGAESFDISVRLAAE